MDYQIVFAGTVLDDLALQDRKSDISRLLHEHVCEVTFTKVDGSMRTMPCTLKSDVIPARVVKEGADAKPARAPKPDLISVWCLDKNEWRSFKVANVLEVKVTE